MNMITGKLFRVGRRQLHTIVSREIIKPSSPTPSHLQTYNLSVFDQNNLRSYQPLVLFYPNYDQSSSTTHHKAPALKRSLSQSLTQYYPLAGQLISPLTTAPYVACNDKGVLFLEARNELPLNKFLKNMEHDETLDQLFPNGLVWNKQSTKAIGGFNDWTSLLEVQLNHFACGGIAVAVSLFHKIGDACTLCNFVNHWASVTRWGSNEHKEVLVTNPHLISFPRTTVTLPDTEIFNWTNLATKTFVFPNSKLTNLKLKVQAMVEKSKGVLPNPTTRVEVLNWLLQKCASKAAKETNLGSFKSSGGLHTVNMRNKLVEQLPETTMGNLIMVIVIPTTNESEIMPDAFISQLQKGKRQLQRISNLQVASETLVDWITIQGIEAWQYTFNNFYLCTSICRFPLYQADFGWGRPVRATIARGVLKKNSFVLVDTPNGDGIEAHVTLSEEDMAIFQNDKELLAFW